MAKALTISRRLSGPWFDGVKRHAGQAGQIMWGWNFLQSGLLHIFHQIVSPDNRPLALALWHSIQSDKAQRDMLLSAAKATLAEQPKLLGDIDWLVKRADDLSPYRNDSAHTGISLGGVWDAKRRFRMMVYPDQNSSKPSSLERLLARPVDSYWRTVKGDLWVLGRYATSVAGRINGDGSFGPLLRRPRLLSLPPKKKRARRKPRVPLQEND